jgi:hypothetical protein
MPDARKITRVLAAIVCGGLLSFGPAISVGVGIGGTASPVMASASDKDTIVFSNGRVVEGRITKETADRVWIEIEVAGIKAPADYAKSDILSIVRAEKREDDSTPAEPAKNRGAAPIKAEAKPEAKAGAPKVYVVELKGEFGVDISETPIRQAIRDARQYQADYLIFALDNDWSFKRWGHREERTDDESEFDKIFRAEKIYPIYTEEVEREWDKQPTVIFWVKKAMGGAAFLPLSVPNIYFHSEGRMGGIGKMEKRAQQADQVVREKWFGAGMAHLEGMALKGGYDPRLVRAMARDDYVLSVAFEGGRPVYHERMPSAPGEELLTDDGKDTNEDSDADLARGLGNDNLTLTADLAHRLGISKGTVDTLDDLLFQLGIARHHQIVKGRSDQIRKMWSEGVEKSKKHLQRLWEDYGQVQVQAPGEYQQRVQARGQRKKILQDMLGLLRRYEEAINPRQLRIPTVEQIEIMLKQIEFEALADRR